MPDFPEMVGYFKGLRESYQQVPAPVPFPPHFFCYDGETTVGQLAPPDMSPQSIAMMFSAIAVLHADWAVVSLESIVRSVDAKGTDGPIGQDPNAKPALITVAAAKKGGDVSVDAFQVDDAGAMAWQPGIWWSPLPGLLMGAMHEVFDAEVPNSVADFVVWMQLNRFAIKVHPSLYQTSEDD